MTSRNQREGKYIPGWCYNPGFKKDKDGKIEEKVRAGKHFTLVPVRNFNDHGFILPGVTFVRYMRQGAFE